MPCVFEREKRSRGESENDKRINSKSLLNKAYVRLDAGYTTVVSVWNLGGG